MNCIKNNKSILAEGFKDGIPIGLGYLAVAFSLGIAAKNVGLNVFQSFLVSLLCNASAGEYAGFLLIGSGATYITTVLMTLVANARYCLMSFALSQKMTEKTTLKHRLLVGFDITDELFAITISRKGEFTPYYTYGAMMAAIPGWSVGSALGTLAGNLMPERFVTAFSVALYGMFLAVIIPKARESKIICILIIICFALSYGASVLPMISALSEGTRTLILTVGISAVAAILFPVNQYTEDENEQKY